MAHNFKLRSGLFTLVALGAFAWVAPAFAGAVTFPDTTNIVPFNGSTASGAPTDVLGPFNTTQVVVSETTNGISSTIDFKFTTEFNGSYPAGTNTAQYADMFFGTDQFHPETFTYAAELGFQSSANNGLGGLGTAGKGFYQLGTYLTSQDIWKTHTSYIYGGQFVGPGTDGNFAAPVVVTGGTNQGWTENVSVSPSGTNNIVDVSLTTDPTTFNLFFQGGNFWSMYWGTGDCSNDGIFIEVPPGTITLTNIPVPEPLTLSLFGAGLAGAIAMRRHKRKRA